MGNCDGGFRTGLGFIKRSILAVGFQGQGGMLDVANSCLFFLGGGGGGRGGGF